MKKNIKRVAKTLLVIFCVIGVIALGWFAKFQLTPITYSNLVDAPTQQEVLAILKEAGVPEENLQTFQTQIEQNIDFLKTDYPTFHPGFQTIKGTIVPYDEYLAWNLFSKAMQPADINCRFAAFNLMQDLITAPAFTKDREAFAYENTIFEYNDATGMDQAEYDLFLGLFESIDARNVATNGQYQKHIQATFKERGVEFEESNRSLISVFMHDPTKKTLEAQHVGVMIEVEDKLYFVEKVMPTLPFQVSIFNSKKELKNHLQQRFLVRFLPRVIFMQNDQPF
ncbi:MAG: DUF4300 family protein [Erysipelotrichaceae bacterium]